MRAYIPKKMLVTGSAGFIGSNFVHFVLRTDPKITVISLDKLTYAGDKANLAHLPDEARHTFIQGDICDQKAVADVLPGTEVIVNFAAQTHVDRSIADAAEFVQTNVFGTQVLLAAAKKYQVNLFCQISTDEVYGSTAEGAFKETDTLKPSSPYSASKAAADHLAFSYYVTYQLPIVIVRPTNNFGPYQFPEKVIPLFITNALQGKKLPVYGDGRNVRDWIYVLDNCAGIDFVIHHGQVGEIYNLAGNNQWKNIDLTKLIIKNLKKSEQLIEFVQDRHGHDLRYALDSTKVASLGWGPAHDFQQALKKTIDWYQNNQTWWQALK